MTFRQMELFVDVCENGSITNASRHSHVSPQGISRTIRQLEEELGSELITRTHSGISVTPRGSFFYEECRRVLKWKTDIPMVLSLTRRLAEETDFRIIVFPNAGFPDEHNHYPTTPAMFQREMWPFFNEHLVNIIGGCCGTTDEHMAALVPLAQPAPGCFVTPHQPGTRTSRISVPPTSAPPTGTPLPSHSERQGQRRCRCYERRHSRADSTSRPHQRTDDTCHG